MSEQTPPARAEAGLTPSAPSAPETRRADPAPGHGVRLWLGFAAALLAGTLLMTLIGTPTGHSYGFNIPWLIAFEAALAEGAAYPRHLPALWFGLGGLDFFFYGPLPFYLAAGPAALLCPGCAPQTVFALAGGLLWAASALAFLPLARLFLPLGPGLAAALIYALLPYHLAVDWFARQAVGEFAAYVFVPLMAAGMVRAMRGGPVGPVFALATAGLILCHLPSVLLAAHVFGAVFLAWALAHPRAALPAAGRLLVAGGTGLALAALYWLPALVLLGDVSPAALYAPHMTAETWLYPGGLGGPDPALALQILICLAAALVATLLALAARRAPPGPAPRSDWLLWVALPVVLGAVLMSAPSRPLWEGWILDRVQFPFRLMLFVDLATALAGGALVAALAAAKGWPRRLVPLAGLAVLALALAASGPRMLRTGLAGVAAVGAPVRMAGAPEYLPPPLFEPLAETLRAEGRELWRVPGLLAEREPALRATANAEAAPGAPRRWTVTLPPAEVGPDAGPNSDPDSGPDPGLETDPQTDAAPVVVALPYWRHLRARDAAGAPVVLGPSPEGLTRFDPPAQGAEVTIGLPWHWSERTGLGLSLAGLAGLIALAWRRRPAR